MSLNIVIPNGNSQDPADWKTHTLGKAQYFSKADAGKACLPYQFMGFPGTQRIVYFDKIIPYIAGLHLKGRESQADDRVGIGSQSPQAVGVGWVGTVGKPRRGKAGDLSCFCMQGVPTAI